MSANETKFEATEKDEADLARFWECADDGQDTDIGRPALDRLVCLGWLVRVRRNRWEITEEGLRVLETTADGRRVLAQ